MADKLFCEISPLTYKLAVWKNIMFRHIKNIFGNVKYATGKTTEKLPVCICSHKSLIRRVLGNVDLQLQENKAVNLALSAPKVNGVIIQPGEVFSFWKLVGSTTKAKGYKEGLTISNSKTSSGIGGGMCQFTNLIHWMVLHSPLEIVEHHHHDEFDLFPDHNRTIPFGTGTSIMYNYLDYRVKNPTDRPFQLIVYVDDTHLCGELRSAEELDVEYHIEAEGECFVREGGEVFREGKVFRSCIDRKTGDVLFKEQLRNNHAKVMYDATNLEIIEKVND